MATKKVIGLVRASSDKQETESQRMDLVEYILKDGVSMDEIHIIENKESATKSQELKGLNELYIVIGSNPIETIYCWDIGRLSRIGVVLEGIRNTCIDKKIQLVCKQQNFRLLQENKEPDFNSLLIFDLYKNMVVQDAKYRREASMRGTKTAASNNQFIGGDVIIGYIIDDHKHYQIDTENSKIVKYIFDLYVNGSHSFASIEKEIIKKYSINFDRKTIGRILNNPYYYGEKIKTNKHKFERQYPAIITKETFEKCQSLLKQRSNRKSDKSKNIYYAGRLIKCRCGETLVAFGTQNQYKCKSFIENRGCTFGDAVNLNVADSLSLKIAYDKDFNELKNFNEAKRIEVQNLINENQAKIDAAGSRLEIIKENKRKSLKKVLKNMSTKDFEKTLENELLIDKQEIDNELIDYRNEINRLQTYLHKFDGNKFKIGDVTVDLSLPKPDSPNMYNYKKGIEHLSDKQRYDLTHQYIKLITVKNLNPKLKEITITTHCNEVSIYHYYTKEKNNEKRLFEIIEMDNINKQIINPLNWNYLIIKRFLNWKDKLK